MSKMIGIDGDILDDEGYSDRHREAKRSTKSILSDMVNIHVPNYIKNEAENVYGLMDSPVRKDEERKVMVFCCILFAYAKLDIICSPKEIANKVGVNRVNIPKMVSKYSVNRIGYHPPQRFYTLPQHTEFLMNKIGLDTDYHSMVLEYAEDISNSELMKGNIQPDLIAGGVILYVSKYMMSEGTYESFLSSLYQYINCNEKALPDVQVKVCNHINGH